MNQNKSADRGYTTHLLGENNSIFTPIKRKPKPSFNILEVTEIENTEILKLNLGSALICRVMKYTSDNENKTPMLTFDLVNLDTKTVEFKAPNGFPNGVGFGAFLAEYNQITQWEVVAIDLLSRSFLYGNQADFRKTVEDFNIKISQQVDWFIRNRLD